MGEGAEYAEWIEEMHSRDKALHEQGRCEYPCPYCEGGEMNEKIKKFYEGDIYYQDLLSRIEERDRRIKELEERINILLSGYSSMVSIDEVNKLIKKEKP